MRHLQADAKGSIALGTKYAGVLFLEIEKNGKIVLEKAEIIPERKLWLHKNKKVKKSVLKGLEQAKKGKLKLNAIDLNEKEL